ncbi:MAG: acyltransferase [Candidatus Thermoplasmatota archaeon]|nr:acyltransferase [Candidatus Thermoplasmatota archaeon]
METFYTATEMKDLGLKEYGDDVRISRKSSIYNPDKVSIGDNVRIDDFTVLSGLVTLGSYIHIAAYTAVYGQNGVVMDDFSGLSARVLVYSTSDDYSGEWMTNPTVPAEYKREVAGAVRLGRHSIVGAGSIVMPGVQIGEGAAVGAMSLVTKNLDPWTIYWGIPCKAGKPRNMNALELEVKLKAALNGSE